MAWSSIDKVSVVMSVYNERPAFLAKAIDSILAQSYGEFEFVIVNDGSTTSVTVDLLNKYAASDGRIRLFHTSKQGLTSALNFAIEKSRGEFICRQDSDDWSSKDRLRCQVEFLDDHPEVGLVGSYYEYVTEKELPLWTEYPPCDNQELLKAFFTHNPFCHGSVAFRRICFDSLGGYDIRFPVSQDYEFFWRLCERYGCGVVPSSLYSFRVTGRSVSTLRTAEQLKYAAMVRHAIRNYEVNQMWDIEGAARAASEHSIKLHSTGIPCGIIGDRLLLAGQLFESKKKYFESIRHNPRSIISWLKLIRMLLFISFPALRKFLFTGFFSAISRRC